MGGRAKKKREQIEEDEKKEKRKEEVQNGEETKNVGRREGREENVRR